MQENKEKTKRIWLHYVLPIVLAVAVAVSVVLAVDYGNKASAAEARLHDSYSKSFNEVVDNVANINVSLNKLKIVTNQKQYISILNEIWSKSNQARALLGQIPLSRSVSSRLSSFITQTGDFCYMLQKKVVKGQTLDGEDQKQIDSIRKTCEEISSILIDIQNQGVVNFSQANQEVPSEGVEENQNPFRDMPDSEDQYPQLIYDGPFSDSTRDKQPKALEDREVDAEEGKQIALEFLGDGTTLERDREVGGKIPNWMYSGTLQDGTEISVSVTKSGQMLWMSPNKAMTGGVPSEDKAQECADLAKAYLEERGFSAIPSYAQYYSGMAVINMAMQQDDVILYSDLIKVWVDIENGQVIGFDFWNYLMSHQGRALDQPALSVEDARSFISDNLNVESEGRLALIPMEDNSETLCYEFDGMYDERRFIVYINAMTGEEENVFLIIDTDNGTMVQ
ncbi:MAG: PepSY1/2 domain-containing protein [Christensenellales bacterium]|jgi:spore germination protein